MNPHEIKLVYNGNRYCCRVIPCERDQIDPILILSGAF